MLRVVTTCPCHGARRRFPPTKQSPSRQLAIAFPTPTLHSGQALRFTTPTLRSGQAWQAGHMLRWQ